VVAETGEAVVGASVSNVTIGSSTQTDENGNFELSGSVGNELRISMVGYSAKTVTVTGPQVNVTIVATDQNLDEVVVVGYGKQKKVNLTGAVAQIDSKVLQDRPVANATQALQGAVPNLNINFT